MKKHKRKLIGKHRKIILALLVLFGIFAFVFGAKVVLYVNFLLGNDIIVKLTTDKEDLTLVRGENKTVTFELSTTTTPFCQASCVTVFEDVSHGIVMEKDELVIFPGSPVAKQFHIEATRRGDGQDIYRFSAECNSVQTFLCHTNEETTSRKILLTVAYHPTEEEERLKATSLSEANSLVERIENIGGLQNSIEKVSEALNETNTTSLVITLRQRISQHELEMHNLLRIWMQQDYIAFADELQSVRNLVDDSELRLRLLNASVVGRVQEHNFRIMSLQTVRGQLISLDNLQLINNSGLYSLAENFNRAAHDQSYNHTSLAADVEVLFNRSRSVLMRDVMTLAVDSDIAADALCQVAGVCITHASIPSRAAQTEFDMNTTCFEIEKVRNAHPFVGNVSLSNITLNNVATYVKNVKQNITNGYIESIPENASNSKLLNGILEYGNVSFNNKTLPTNAIINELFNRRPGLCEVSPALELANFNVSFIEVPEDLPVMLGVRFDEQPSQCCVFGECHACCVDDKCRENRSTTPVVFLHGHAFNKDTSAEYSLDAFNKIQKRLEKDGFLNAGSISLYTDTGTARGTWGMAPVPLTVKASYYLDLFQQPDNYVVVQTKSENIDTYANRLKELIDTIQYKTGRNKVTIVAHSMGGLVARRYARLFGSGNIEQIILIGTANGGIVGDIADYCGLVGEKLECRDMNEKSLFLNKLNRGELPDVPVHNIFGSGCVMKQGDGDGVVLVENAELEGANNYVVKGSCDKFKTLHTDLLDVDSYPEVYEIILDVLR
jgi:pimeloyl-ACP methyl ester carboxylesterase